MKINHAIVGFGLPTLATAQRVQEINPWSDASLIEYGIYTICGIGLIAFAAVVLWCLCDKQCVREFGTCKPCREHGIRPLNVVIHEATVETVEESTRL